MEQEDVQREQKEVEDIQEEQEEEDTQQNQKRVDNHRIENKHSVRAVNNTRCKWTMELEGY